MRMMSIASGSSGNCIYIGSDNTHILIDAGVSRKRIAEGLRSIGLCTRDISGILITHEHSDHIRGLGALSKKDGIPIYASVGTAAAVLSADLTDGVQSHFINALQGVEKFLINDLEICPFRIPHDANEPTAYRVNCGGRCAAVVTDLGTYDQGMIDNLQGLDAILVESNHDVRMLQSGSYPYYLKKRILSERGHLSNEDSGRFLSKLLNDHVKHVFLGHLSRENNFPELAYETVRLEVELGDNPYRAGDFNITVAGREQCSEVVEF